MVPSTRSSVTRWCASSIPDDTAAQADPVSDGRASRRMAVGRLHPDLASCCCWLSDRKHKFRAQGGSAHIPLPAHPSAAGPPARRSGLPARIPARATGTFAKRRNLHEAIRIDIGVVAGRVRSFGSDGAGGRVQRRYRRCVRRWSAGTSPPCPQQVEFVDRPPWRDVIAFGSHEEHRHPDVRKDNGLGVHRKASLGKIIVQEQPVQILRMHR